MASNFLNPFALTAQGSIATTSDPYVIATQRVESLVGTPPGERVMQPTYGVPLPDFLFAPDLAADVDQIATDTAAALQVWEPSINVSSVTPIVNSASEGIDNISVDFITSNDPTFTPTQTATVLVGGTVTGN
jgi:phage baseplate assembly protein W